MLRRRFLHRQSGAPAHLAALPWRAAAIAAAAALPSPASAQRAPRLVLTEVSAFVLPQHFNFTGLSAGHGGRLVAWAQQPNVVITFGDGLRPDAQLTLPDTVPPLAVWAGPTGLEVVTASPPAIHHLDGSGTVQRTDPMAIDGIVLDAERGPDGWYVLSEEMSTGALAVHPVGSPVVHGAPSYGALTIGPEGNVLLTETRSPFGVHDLAPGGPRSSVAYPPTDVGDELRSSSSTDSLSDWVSLPVVAIEGGAVQTLADLSADRRVILVYDERWKAVSTLRLDVPLGLLASVPGRERVYAARRTNVLEIVEYRYGWGPPGTDHPPR